MPFNGSGTFTRVHDWVTDRINGIKILAARMDEEFDGIATGLSNTVTRDGQSTISANIPFNNKRITGLADATAATDALNRQTADARLFLRAEAEQSVASASTIDVSATGLRWEVTGTTGITTITMGNITLKVLRFADAVTLTHHATTLILPGASNLTTAAGDVLWFMSDASGNARLMTYQSGTAAGALLDEDDFASDSDTDGATQQSIKAYVDGEIAGFTGGGPSLGTNSVIRTNATNIIEDIELADHKTTFTADDTADTLDVGTSDGYADEDVVYLSTTGTLPAGLSTATAYYVRDVAASTLKLAATNGGSAIDITDTGSGTHTIHQPINGMSAGPITVESGHTVTIAEGSTWTVV